MMKATAFEFRFRTWIMVAWIGLGFWAPWVEWLHLGTRTTTWLWLGFQLGGFVGSPTSGILMATALVITVAAIAATIRIWGTAYLGANTVLDAQMKAGPMAADGPYRYVRNPLYIGSFLVISVISVLMPPAGSAVTLVLLAIFLFRLILGEEAFLAPRLGEPYAAYCKAVPRLIPSLRPGVAAGGCKPHWGEAFVGEILSIGVLVSFAGLSWQYNSELLIRAVLISFGVSLVARAFISGPKASQPSAV
jgi:protein-S-isoprenylcysteine O-methyltransferase Ste14